MSNRLRLFMQGIYLFLLCHVCFFSSALYAEQEEGLPTIYEQTISQENFAEKNYKRLEKAIAFFDAAAAHPEMYPWPTIPDTERLMHRGAKNHAVFALRQLLKTTHDLSEEANDSNLYDRQVERAVKLFQWRHGLNADGVVGPKTLTELNVSPQARAEQMRLDLQRWKNLIGQVPARFVLVNIPEYKLYLYDNDQEILNMKVIVGKPSWPTPEIQSKITQIVFNPRWNVPHRIAKNDIIPKLMENPNYLNENHIRVFNNQSDNAYEINPRRVNWERAREEGFDYFFRQDAGEVNALGQIKFEFQNTHDVYLHDTPAKTLFSSELRALSHGCIRLEKPFDLGNYLTQDDSRIDEMKIQEKLDSLKTSYFTIRKPIPIFITYYTSWVDDNNIVHFVDDIYHRDDPNYVPPPRDEPEAQEEPVPKHKIAHKHYHHENYDRFEPDYPGEEDNDGLSEQNSDSL